MPWYQRSVRPRADARISRLSPSLDLFRGHIGGCEHWNPVIRWNAGAVERDAFRRRKNLVRQVERPSIGKSATQHVAAPDSTRSKARRAGTWVWHTTRRWSSQESRL